MNIGGLDVGTTGCKLSVYNDKGEFLSSSYCEYDISRHSGEHEIDAAVIFAAVCGLIKSEAVKNKIAAIGVTTFGEAFTVLDENDNVLMPSMLYTDPRGSEECKTLIDRLGNERIISIAGVKAHTMYSIPKIMWIKNHKPEVYEKTRRILLMEDYIVYMLTGNAQIDYSLAARTMAFDIRNKCWSGEIFEAAEIDISLMSEPVPTGTKAGKIKSSIAKELGINEDTIIVNGAHDQVASAVGAGVFEVGQAIDGTGTVECITPMFNTIPDDKRLYDNGYCVVPYVFDNTYVCYAFSFTGGAALKWYRDNFARYEQEKNNGNIFAYLDGKIPKNPTEILIMPHFAGAATPYMNNASKAVIVGLTLEHTNNDIYKALMEGVTYEIMVNVEQLVNYGITPKSLYATGGGASSSAWLQIKADILNMPITALQSKEVGACGTSMLTAVAMGLFDNLRAAGERFIKSGKTFMPNSKKHQKYAVLYEAYKRIYPSTKHITEAL